MIHHVRQMAIRQYQREIADVSEDAAEAALLEMARHGVQVDEVRRDGKVRVRAPARRGAAWSRAYVLVDPSTGDVIGVMPSHAPRISGPSGKHREDLESYLLREERPGQLAKWKAAAHRAEQTLSAWIREALDRAATK